MVYSANPISKEQLQRAINAQLEESGLPTNQKELTEQIKENADLRSVVSIRAKPGTSSYVFPVLPMDTTVNMEDNEEFLQALKNNFSFDDDTGLRANVCVYNKSFSPSDTPFTEAVDGMDNLLAAMREKNIFTPNAVNPASQPGYNSVGWTLSFQKPIRCNAYCNFKVVVRPYQELPE